MFGTIKRVISNPEELGNKEGKISKTEVDAAVDTVDTATKVVIEHTPSAEQKMASASSPPAVVECDDRVKEEAVVSIVADPNSSVSMASSVSDHSADGDTGKHNDVTDAYDFDADSPTKTGRSGTVRNESPLSRPDSHVSTDSVASSIRTGATSSRDWSGNWGWFEDVHGADGSSFDHSKMMGKDGDNKRHSARFKRGSLLQQYAIAEPLNDAIPRSMDSAAMAVTAPTYVLEESLSSQKLWKDTAGTRPPQPVEERAFYEKMWAQNFERSQVNYKIPVEVLTASSPIYLSPFADSNFDVGADGRRSELSNYNLPSSDEGGAKGKDGHLAAASLINQLHDPSRPHFSKSKEAGGTYQLMNKIVKGTDSEGDLRVLIRGDNVFGTTVSKSFAWSDDKGGAVSGVDTINISIAGYRVVESKKHEKYAQFLVIYREGSIRDTVGVWKRYSDFVELSRLVTASHEGCSSVLANMSPLSITEEQEVEHLPNAITSWRLLKKRQRWYRCLDEGYLSLKVFLLERFLHDILFECTSPKLLRDFALGA